MNLSAIATLTNSPTIAVQSDDPRIGPRTAGHPPPCRVEALQPTDETAWDAFVRARSRATLFHTLAWRNATSTSFNHEAIYLIAKRDDCIVGILPLFLVASRLAGRMLVSVPYGVGGGIVADDQGAIDALFDEAKRIAAERRCGVIDLRSDEAILADVPVSEGYVGFRRALPDSPDAVLDWLPRKARAAARNARRKFGLTVSFGDEHLPEVWSLYTRTMRRIGSINYPLRYFEALVAQTPDAHLTSIVRRAGKPVAGLLTFCHRDAVMPYFVGTADDGRRCSAANFIYLTLAEWAVEAGYRVFDFGRSRRDNVGSFNFKRFHGFEPRPLGYQMWCADGTSPARLSAGDTRFAFARRVWKYLPIAATRKIGAMLAADIPG